MSSAAAQTNSPSYFLSVQDGRARLVDGVPAVGSADDSLAVIEVSGNQLRVRHQLAVPTSLVGPPSSIALAPSGRMALISAATRRDPSDANKVVPYDLVSIVALDPSGQAAPRVVGSLRTGAGASGVSINRAGTLALVANRVEGTVSVLAIEGERAEVIDKVALGDNSGPAHAAFTPDGGHALVSRDGDNRISLLTIKEHSVTLDSRVLYAGLRPYSLDVAADGAWAAVTNLGAGQGDSDTISLIDLQARPPRVVDTVSVGQSPEGIVFAPDSRTVGVSVINGSNKPRTSPFHDQAVYAQFRVEAGRFQAAGRVVGGQWLQGHAFSADGRDVLVQDAASRQVRLYRVEGGTLVDTGGRLEFDAAPCAIRFWR